MTQNIFDNDTFFKEYMDLRFHKKNLNDLIEQPQMKRLLPEIKNKTILDIGCGFGHNCLSFAKAGARHVTGIDISVKMLEIAHKSFSHPVIDYLLMNMDELHTLQETYDLVYSSLAFHYAEDFTALIHNIYELLNPGGILLFSQEHPLMTASQGKGGHYNYDENGNCISYTFSDYGREGKRSGFWYVDHVENYHRTMGSVVSTLAHAGFMIEDMVEALPDQKTLNEYPKLNKEFIKPTFLILRAKKVISEV